MMGRSILIIPEYEAISVRSLLEAPFTRAWFPALCHLRCKAMTLLVLYYMVVFQ